MTKSLDPTCSVIGNEGWESVATDIIDIHDYDDRPEWIVMGVMRCFLDGSNANGQSEECCLLLGSLPSSEQPVMLTGLGGIAFSRERGCTWGDIRCRKR